MDHQLGHDRSDPDSQGLHAAALRRLAERNAAAFDTHRRLDEVHDVAGATRRFTQLMALLVGAWLVLITALVLVIL